MNKHNMMHIPVYSDAQLAVLRTEAEGRLSPARFAHTRGVEEMAARLAALYLPEGESLLRAAALLHDITKEEPDAWHLMQFDRYGRVLRADEAASPAIWHGFSAALIIPERYPAFADPVLTAAVDKHTTGAAGMGLATAILYLADYLEEGRTYPALVALREGFFGRHPETMSREARLSLLRETLIASLQNTLGMLAARGAGISRDTEQTLAWLLCELHPFD